MARSVPAAGLADEISGRTEEAEDTEEVTEVAEEDTEEDTEVAEEDTVVAEEDTVVAEDTEIGTVGATLTPGVTKWEIPGSHHITFGEQMCAMNGLQKRDGGYMVSSKGSAKEGLAVPLIDRFQTVSW